MKTSWMKWLSAATLAAACGTQPITEPVEYTPGPQTEPPATNVERSPFEFPKKPRLGEQQPELPPVTQPTLAHLRMRGTEVGAFQHASLQPGDIRIAVDGKEIAVTPVATEIDVAVPTHAWLLATFELPVGAKVVQVAIDPVDEGGLVVDPNGTVALDAAGKPLYFEAPAGLIEQKDKLVLELDLARSLQDTGEETRELVANWKLVY